MTDTAEKYRAGQEADFDRHDVAADDPIRKVVGGVYDTADKLSEDQQSLFTLNAVASACAALSHAVDNLEDAANPIRAQLILAESLLSVAGYIAEQDREVKGWTSTEDKLVEATYQAVKTMVRESTLVGLPEEDRERVDTITEAIRQRISAGDGPPEKIIREEVEKAGGMPGTTFQVGSHEYTTPEATTAQEEASTGLYL